MPLLSIVVPFYGVETYFDACLESLQRQTFEDFEVVLVDDGSLDGSRVVAEKYVANDPRFRLVTQENQGLGPARNTGVKHATGEFLTFVDSDDIVHLRAYERMLDVLRAGTSDFVICRAERFSSFGAYQSAVHEVAIEEDLVATHILERPELVLDRMAWNKVYRRSFWDAAELEFPAMLLEDFPVSVLAHVKARAVDVLGSRLYYWRERDGGDPSITQRSAEFHNISDRVESALMVLRTIEEHAPASLPLLQQHLAEVDVPAVVRAMGLNPPEQKEAILALARRLLDRLGEDPTARSITLYKVIATFVRSGNVAGLEALNDFYHHHGRRAPIARRRRWDRRLVEQIPIIGGQVPLEVRAPGRGEGAFAATIDDAHWEGETLHLDLLLMPGTRLGRSHRVKLWLESEGERIPLESQRLPWRRPFIGIDLVGLRTSVSVAQLLGHGREARRFWRLVVKVVGPDLRTEEPVTYPAFGRGRRIPAARVPERPLLLAQPTRHQPGEYGIFMRRPHAIVESSTVAGTTISIAGVLQHPRDLPDPEAVIQLESPTGEVRLLPVQFGERRPIGATVGGQPGCLIDFSVAFDATTVPDAPDYRSPVPVQRSLRTRLILGGEEFVLAAGADFTSRSVPYGERMVTVTPNGGGNIEILDSRLSPEVHSVSWQGEELVIEGSWQGPEQLPGELRLEHFEQPAHPELVAVPLEVSGQSFRATVDIRALLRVQLHESDPYEGNDLRPWHPVLSFDGRRLPLVVDRNRVTEFAAPRMLDDHRIEFQAARADVFRIGIR